MEQALWHDPEFAHQPTKDLTDKLRLLGLSMEAAIPIPRRPEHPF